MLHGRKKTSRIAVGWDANLTLRHFPVREREGGGGREREREREGGRKLEMIECIRNILHIDCKYFMRCFRKFIIDIVHNLR